MVLSQNLKDENELYKKIKKKSNGVGEEVNGTLNVKKDCYAYVLGTKSEGAFAAPVLCLPPPHPSCHYFCV